MMSAVAAFAPRTPVRWAGGAAVAGLAAGLLAGARWDDPRAAVGLGLFFAVLAVASAVDVAERRIPNALTYPALALALAVAAASGAGMQALGGLALAGGVMAAFWAAGGGRLGLGDVKLSALVGAAVGLEAVPTFLLAGTALGALAGVVVLVATRDRGRSLPYGPWLALGAAVAASMHGLAVV
jgi:leader peptidase (prepilin peptidase) / N-methyltransferase